MCVERAERAGDTVTEKEDSPRRIKALSHRHLSNRGSRLNSLHRRSRQSQAASTVSLLPSLTVHPKAVFRSSDGCRGKEEVEVTEGMEMCGKSCFIVCQQTQASAKSCEMDKHAYNRQRFLEVSFHLNDQKCFHRTHKGGKAAFRLLLQFHEPSRKKASAFHCCHLRLVSHSPFAMMGLSASPLTR